MKSIHSPLATLLLCMAGLLALALIPARAAAQTGFLTGQINDINTGASVTGATVTDTGTGRMVHADREGQFRLDNLAPGTVKLTIDSVGYETKTETVAIPATGRASVQILLGEEVVKLGALVVEGYREGWAKALQQKRNAINFKDMISSDAAGKLPDNNVGEALSRLPGVSLSIDNGEGHYVSIRGTDPNLNTVTMNGAPMAASPDLGRDGRSAPMDLLDASLISQVEVIKTLTPDMDGTSLGGTINILTPSGFDHQGRFIAGGIQYGQNLGDNKPISSADIAYTNVYPLSEGKLGVALTSNYSKRNTRRDRLYNIWGGNESNPVLTEPRLDHYVSVREKYGTAVNLDFRSDNGTRVYAQAFYNHFDEQFDNNEQLYGTRGTITQLSSTKISAEKIRVDMRMISSHRKSDVTNLVFGGSKVKGDYTIDGEVSYSMADDRQDYHNFSFRTGDVVYPGGYTLDYGSSLPVFDVTNYVAGLNPPVRQVRGDKIKNTDDILTASGNVQRNFNNWFGGKTGFLKIGVKYSNRDRDNNRNVGLYNAAGMFLSDFDPSIGTPNPASLYDGHYVEGNTIDPAASRASFNSLLSQGKLQYNKSGSLSNGGEDTFKVVEKIWAAYLMASVDITPQLTVLGGFRYEHTKAPLQGPLFSTDPNTGDPVVTNQKVTFDYGEFLPNLQVRYQISKATQFRAAITKTFGRPAYNDQVPSGEFDKDGGELTIGNPQLKPFESLNYDASIEHYFESGGAVSLAAFYKKIDNPIYTYSNVDTNVTYAGIFFPVFTTSTKENGDSASLSGVELSGKIPFSAFMSGFADGFGVDVNATFMDSSVTVFSRPGEDLRLFESPKRVFNAGLFYDKYGFSARIAYNYKSDSLNSIGADPYRDRYNSPHFTWDAQVGYRISENFSAFINWQNITDEKVDIYTASSPDRIFQSYWFGSNIRAGIRFRF
ncbi:MAG: TonB-dependent receptor [Opitutaceae bacterium]|nr:TonB-dependent receptor [Opitutaceae bacterium]